MKTDQPPKTPIVLIVDLGRFRTLEQHISIDPWKALIVGLGAYDRFVSQRRVPRYAAIGIEPRIGRLRTDEPYEASGFDALFAYPDARDIVGDHYVRLDEEIDRLHELITNPGAVRDRR